jgi:hypothetical protein
VQEARREWKNTLHFWKNDYRWRTATWIQVSPPDPTALNARLYKMQIQLLPRFVHLVGTHDQAAVAGTNAEIPRRAGCTLCGLEKHRGLARAFEHRFTKPANRPGCTGVDAEQSAAGGG